MMLLLNPGPTRIYVNVVPRGSADSTYVGVTSGVWVLARTTTPTSRTHDRVLIYYECPGCPWQDPSQGETHNQSEYYVMTRFVSGSMNQEGCLVVVGETLDDAITSGYYYLSIYYIVVVVVLLLLLSTISIYLSIYLCMYVM